MLRRRRRRERPLEEPARGGCLGGRGLDQVRVRRAGAGAVEREEGGLRNGGFEVYGSGGRFIRVPVGLLIAVPWGVGVGPHRRLRGADPHRTGSERLRSVDSASSLQHFLHPLQEPPYSLPFSATPFLWI